MDLIDRLRRFSGTRLLVLGDLMVDRYIRGRVDRLSPEAPVPVVDVKEEDFMPGGAGNVAANIARLGGRPSVIGLTGEDHDGDALLEALTLRGVDVDGVVRSSLRPTAVKTRVIAGHQQVVRFDREKRDALPSSILNALLSQVKERLPSVKGLVLSDYGKGLITASVVKTVLGWAHRAGKFVLVDPKIEHFLRYRRVDCLTPNLKEATEGLRSLPPKTDADVDALGRRILKRLRVKSVLITRGERGMSLYLDNGTVHHIPSEAQEVFDVTGAGDTVISVFGLALAAGSTLVEAARLANAAAGVVVGKLGTATVTLAELKKALSRR